MLADCGIRCRARSPRRVGDPLEAAAAVRPAPRRYGDARESTAKVRAMRPPAIAVVAYSSISSVTGQWSEPKMSLRMPVARTRSAMESLTRK